MQVIGGLPTRTSRKAFTYDEDTVTCAICSDSIIGPIFFKDDNGASVTIPSHMLRSFFQPNLNDPDDFGGAEI